MVLDVLRFHLVGSLFRQQLSAWQEEQLLQSVPELMDVISKKKITKASSKEHHIKHSEKTNRRIFSPPDQTKKKNERVFKTLRHWIKENQQTQFHHFAKMIPKEFGRTSSPK